MNNFEQAGADYIRSINENNFEDIALALFQHQYRNNGIYKDFTDRLQIDPAAVVQLSEIPFLPVSFFKTHKVVAVADSNIHPALFESSSTTGDTPSRHYLFREELYKTSLLHGFEIFYGKPSGYCILALLPSYLERKNASLVYMSKMLMEAGGHTQNGFYLDDFKKLSNTLQSLEAAGQKTLLAGVTFALLDFAEAFPMALKNTIVMETGGMKGRMEEWTRAQVHGFLKEKWNISQVHSEYGMTELLSQAYAKEKGVFTAAPSMKVLVRDINDPLEVNAAGQGCLNIIDLANIDSCAFIATDDIGNIHADGRFEVLGRMDHSALRGCSLMAV